MYQVNIMSCNGIHAQGLVLCFVKCRLSEAVSLMNVQGKSCLVAQS